jgi:hypothetical protein
MIKNCNNFPSANISSKCYYQKVGVRLWRWNQTIALTLEESCFASPQESTTAALASESNAACFFDHQDILQHEFAPEGQTISWDFYIVVPRHLRDVVRIKRPVMWNAGSWLLHNDNVLAHTVLLIRQFLAKHAISTLPQPPYSCALSPLTFCYSQFSKVPLMDEDFRQW